MDPSLVPRTLDVSVVMSVYNGARYLRQSIESILGQKGVSFEFIIVNDGSTDGTSAVLAEYDEDPRIRVFTRPRAGLGAALAFGVEVATSEFVARQDADDISLPNRLEKQVSYLRSHQEVVLLGGKSLIVGPEGLFKGIHQHPQHNSVLQCMTLFDSGFVHSSVCFRRVAAVNAGNYSKDPTKSPPEDYDLWVKMSKEGKFSNLDDYIIVYRDHPVGLSKTSASSLVESRRNIALANFAQLFPEGTEQCICIYDLYHQDRLAQISWLRYWTWVIQILVRLKTGNRRERFGHVRQGAWFLLARSRNLKRMRKLVLKREVSRAEQLYGEWQTSCSQ